MRIWEDRTFDFNARYAYAATYAGIRKVEKDDLALIVTGLPASAAAVYYPEPRTGRSV